MSAIRLTVVLTHPIQYYSPWFRYIADNCPEIDLNVLYAVEPSPMQQGAEFNRSFSWDVPLTEGYSCRIMRPAKADEELSSSHFRGIDVPEIVDAIRVARPDVVLIPGWHSITLVRALKACRQLGIPTLYRGDTHRRNAPAGFRHASWYARTWSLLRLYSGYLNVGQRTRDYLRHFGIPETKIFSSPHCVDNRYFAQAAGKWQNGTRSSARRALGLPDDAGFVVLFAGKLEEKKRPLDLIRAMNRLERGTTLLVAGTGPLEEACRTEALKEGVRTVWAGFLNQSEIGQAYAAADCLALPSNWGETWGLVVNEAMAAGVPCVVSDRVGCAPDMITSGETGEIFPMGREDALAEAVTRVRVRLSQGHDYQSACRSRAQRHSLEQATTGLLAACQAVPRRRATVRVIALCGGMVVVSGLESMIFEALSVLRERDVRVHCVVNEWENHRIVALAESVGATWSTGHYIYALSRHSRNPLLWIRMMWGVLRSSFGLLRIAARVRPTHILVPEMTMMVRNAPALLLLRGLGARIIIGLQNAPAQGRFYHLAWSYLAGPLASRVVCCSDYVRKQTEKLGVQIRKLVRVYNTVPRHRLDAPNPAVERNPRRLLYVGQVIPEKGLDLLLEAVELLVQRGYDCTLDVAGSIDGWVHPKYAGFRDGLRARAARPVLAGRVRFLGWRQDIPELLRGAAVHCFPSRPEMLEGLPVVVLEAKLSSVPTVAFKHGPAPEMISHKVDGCLCPDLNAESLAEGIEHFLSDPESSRRAGLAAMASAERFSHARFSEGWLRTFGLEPTNTSA